jgi:hypothetical protein
VIGVAAGNRRSGAPSVDQAARRAREVVGLYGDPDVTWSVLLALRLRVGLEVEAVADRVGELLADHPHLGSQADVEVVSGDPAQALDRAANLPYGNHGALLRVTLTDGGRTLVLAAHHGAIDGLGLLGVAAAVTGLPLTSGARGVPPDAEPGGFARRSLGRLAEAFVAPPVRLAASARGGDGDWLLAREVVAPHAGTATLVLAGTETVRAWNAGRRTTGRRPVLALGLSRRPGDPTPAPDRDTAYSRVRVAAVSTREEAARVIAETRPEPAFPVTDGRGWGPRLVRLLSSRLGSTMLVSNLGLVAHDGVERVDFWPVATGPAGVCVGLASSPSVTSVTVRARRSWFDQAQAARLMDLVAEQVERAGR